MGFERKKKRIRKFVEINWQRRIYLWSLLHRRRRRRTHAYFRSVSTSPILQRRKKSIEIAKKQQSHVGGLLNSPVEIPRDDGSVSVYHLRAFDALHSRLFFDFNCITIQSFRIIQTVFKYLTAGLNYAAKTSTYLARLASLATTHILSLTHKTSV